MAYEMEIYVPDTATFDQIADAAVRASARRPGTGGEVPHFTVYDADGELVTFYLRRTAEMAVDAVTPERPAVTSATAAAL